MGMLFKVDEDRLNEKHKRNARNTKRGAYNCGGYALGTYTWYLPYDRDPIDPEDLFMYDDENEGNNGYWSPRDRKIARLIEEGYDEKEIMEIVLQDDVDYMIKDFGGRLRVINSPNEVSKKDTVIAYRIGIVIEDQEIGEFWNDFHFIVRRHGKWKEKCGASCITDSDFDPDYDDDWETDAGWYNSDIVFMVLEERKR